MIEPRNVEVQSADVLTGAESNIGQFAKGENCPALRGQRASHA